MSIRRFVVAALLVGGALVGTAAPAWAHTELKTSNPAEGASLTAVPQTIELTFTGAVTVADNPITVTGPDGVELPVGKATAAGVVVSAPFPAAVAGGAYRIDFQVMSDDGHRVKGAVKFTVALPVATTPPVTTAPSTTAAPPATTGATSAAPTSVAVAPAASEGSGVPAWIWVVVAAAVAGAGVFATNRLRRRSGSGQG